MKRIYYIACVLLQIAPLGAHPAPACQLDELCSPESVCLLEVEETVRLACRLLCEGMQGELHHTCPELAELLNATSSEIEAETVLRALAYCIQADCCPNTEDIQELRAALAEVYEQLAQEYNERIARTTRHRIKVKFYNKVTTGELVVTQSAYFNDVNIQRNLIVRNLTGALIATNGLVTTGQIPASAIPDGSITNSKLAPNAVNTTNIAPMSITPGLLAFNTVQTFAGEPNPLRVYRGSVTGATGAVTSGSGFTVTRTGVGAYTVNISGPAYTSNATYQVFIQLLSETNPVTLVNVSGSQFTVNTVADHDFSFFTIGN